MKGIKGFIVGFSVSLVSVSFAGQLYSEHPQNKPTPKLKQNIEINLFKGTNTQPSSSKPVIFSSIKKESLKTGDTQIIAENNINSENDEEILSINIDNIIPIDFTETSESAEQIQVSGADNTQDIVASLPDVSTSDNENSPWIVAKGSNHIKNKKAIEEYAKTSQPVSIQDDTSVAFNDDETVSYKVAERIKQSIIFPIPDEILNDRNLTPTFIKKDTTVNKSKSPTQKKQAQTPKKAVAIKSAAKDSTKNIDTSKKDDGILNNISSWFSSDKKETKAAETKKQTKAPSYSSSNTNEESTKVIKKTTTNKHNEDFVNFYRTLQETTREHEKDRAIPEELRLSFQPERAEISGQTLNWIKAFSQKAKTGNNILQIQIDSNTSVELQRKRLSLLYAIFMNNGVDSNKIEATLSNTGANYFIVRLIKF